MHEKDLEVLQCPRCHKALQITNVAPLNGNIGSGGMVCKKGHRWTISDGIPSLIYPPMSGEDEKWISEYNEMAEIYDEAVKVYDEWLGINIQKERENIIRSIINDGPKRIIDVSIGTAANYVALANVVGNAAKSYDLHGVDLSRGMIHIAMRKMQELGIDVGIVHANVLNLPYRKDSFDIVIHTGGINTFSDKASAMNEMLRITKPEGIVVVIDEGLSPDVRESERGKSIINKNSLFAARPPLENIPDKARDVELKYIMNGTFYQIIFRK